MSVMHASIICSFLFQYIDRKRKGGGGRKKKFRSRKTNFDRSNILFDLFDVTVTMKFDKHHQKKKKKKMD